MLIKKIKDYVILDKDGKIAFTASIEDFKDVDLDRLLLVLDDDEDNQITLSNNKDEEVVFTDVDNDIISKINKDKTLTLIIFKNNKVFKAFEYK